MILKYFDRKSEILEKMRASRNVYVYGAGEFAKDIEQYLLKNDIFVRNFVVDDEFHRDNMKESDKICSMSSYLQESSESGTVFLIWGIVSPTKLKCELRNNRLEEAWITYEIYNMWEDTRYAHKHREEFEHTRNILKDELSRRTLDGYLAIFDGVISDDLENIVDNIYYNELTMIYREGCFIDCGAYVGDTAIKFNKIINKNSKIICFEPDPGNYTKLIENTKDLGVVTAINAGTWSNNTRLRLDNKGNSASCITEDGAFDIEVVSIDQYVKEDRVAFVKMDVEGSELNSLIGMKQVIERDMPILAISAYHKQEDLITIPQFISQFESEQEQYDLYLRHHGCAMPELVLYAIPRLK